MKFLIFDSEFTDTTGELLELSVFGIDGNELYHSYFKPRRAKAWMLYPHNITPEMVADKPYFDKENGTLQQLFDSATHLVGFEVESDIDHLHAQGIKNLYNKKIVELRDFYWLARGKDDGNGLYNIPGLEKCITALDITFDENGAHSASGDTRATWQLLMRLLEMTRVDETENVEDTWERARLLIVDERRRLAHGYVTLLKDGLFYKVNGGTMPPDTKNPRYVTHIEVADWKQAICELEVMRWARYCRGPREGLYKLGPKEIKQFNKYKNEYDPERADEFRKMYNLSKRR